MIEHEPLGKWRHIGLAFLGDGPLRPHDHG
jgi:hypothetical protein